MCCGNLDGDCDVGAVVVGAAAIMTASLCILARCMIS